MNSTTMDIGSVAPVKRTRLIDINEWITCYLCGGYLIDAMTLIECQTLHSFCKSCIFKYLKEMEMNGSTPVCPTCDEPLNESKPHLSMRQDTKLQDIVYKLVPGLYKREMERRREFYKKLGSSDPKGEVTKDSLFYVPHDKISLSLEYHLTTSLNDTDSSSSSFNDNNNHVNSNGTNHKRKGDSSNSNGIEESSERRYLLCEAGMPVYLLKKFIVQKYSLDRSYQVHLMYNNHSLTDDLTLIDVIYIYSWCSNDPMRFYYTIEKSNKKLKSSSPVTIVTCESMDEGEETSPKIGKCNPEEEKDDTCSLEKDKTIVSPLSNCSSDCSMSSVSPRSKHHHKHHKHPKKGKSPKESKKEKEPKATFYAVPTPCGVTIKKDVVSPQPSPTLKVPGTSLSPSSTTTSATVTSITSTCVTSFSNLNTFTSAKSPGFTSVKSPAVPSAKSPEVPSVKSPTIPMRPAPAVTSVKGATLSSSSKNTTITAVQSPAITGVKSPANTGVKSTTIKNTTSISTVNTKPVSKPSYSKPIAKPSVTKLPVTKQQSRPSVTKPVSSEYPALIKYPSLKYQPPKPKSSNVPESGARIPTNNLEMKKGFPSRFALDLKIPSFPSTNSPLVTRMEGILSPPTTGKDTKRSSPNLVQAVPTTQFPHRSSPLASHFKPRVNSPITAPHPVPPVSMAALIPSFRDPIINPDGVARSGPVPSAPTAPTSSLSALKAVGGILPPPSSSSDVKPRSTHSIRDIIGEQPPRQSSSSPSTSSSLASSFIQPFAYRTVSGPPPYHVPPPTSHIPCRPVATMGISKSRVQQPPNPSTSMNRASLDHVLAHLHSRVAQNSK